MNKELEESYKILSNFKKENSPAVDGDSLFVNKAIKTVLNYIENSIPKEKVKEKMEELSNTKGDFATYIATRERKKVLKELLEGK